MPPDTSGLPHSSAADKQQRLAQWIRAEVERSNADERTQFYAELGKQLEAQTDKINALQKSLDQWVNYVKSLEASTRIYEKQIYEHTASLDQKVAASEPIRSTSLGMWDIAIDFVVPVRNFAQRVVKACLHFESLGPAPRKDSTGQDSLTQNDEQRWRNR